jgi:hypothetical protein
MSTADTQPVQEPPWDAPDEIKRLFDRCALRQKDWLSPSTKPLEIARQWLFEERKFTSPPDAGAAEPLIFKKLYLELVEQLKTADDVMLWYWLGQWFKSEGIRNPDKFLPKKILDALTRELSISGADIRNAYAVRIWLPYTEPLLRRTRWLQQQKTRNPRNALRNLGYDSEAIESAASRRWSSPVEFTCDWVAERTLGSGKEYQRETLVNSYSRYLKRWWSRVNKCSFCPEPAVGEFWVREESIPYCQLHRPDLLPLSENSAWTDHDGRRWWRQNLDIRRIPPRNSP